MQPGETITPGASVPPPNPSPPAPIEDVPLPQSQEPQAQWQYTEGSSADNSFAPPPQGPPSSVTWTASEYVSHPKGSAWFGGFGAAIAGLVIVVFFVTRDILTVILVGIAGIAFGAFAARSPQVLNYQLDGEGLTIGPKHYPYASFKSFSVIDDGPLNSLLFTPLKRYSTPIVVYYDQKDEEKIVDTLSNYLPLEDRGHDMVDKVTRRLRF